MFRYFYIFDTTKDFESCEFAQYISRPRNEDILGYAVEFAKRNGTDIKDIRLHIFDTKKSYEQSYKNWAKQIKV